MFFLGIICGVLISLLVVLSNIWLSLNKKSPLELIKQKSMPTGKVIEPEKETANIYKMFDAE